MAKIGLTKNELKKQRDSLKRFNRYLPMLQLKKLQLQADIVRVDNFINKLNAEINAIKENLHPWIDVFAEEIDLARLIKFNNTITETSNVAGIDIPLFVNIEFQKTEYDYLTTPLWVDKAIQVLSEIMTLTSKMLIFKKQRTILKEELRITSQRVNLFEKVKIPEAIENIRVIQIRLGDLQIANVVRGKIAKDKIEERRELVSV